MFKYKFDNKRYFIKYKTRLYVRNDLQFTEINIYTVTLTTRILWALLAIINTYEFETCQYNVINTFVNSDIDELIYCKLLNEWNKFNILFLLLKTLYNLKQSLILWYKHLLITLTDLKLHQISKMKCFFVNQYIIIFFFINNVVIIYNKKFIKKVDEFQIKLL